MEQITKDQMAELLSAAEGIVDGWYASGRIDWNDFLDRLESQTGIDLGSDLTAPHIGRIKAHVRAYRRQA